MIKVQNGIATREAIHYTLIGLDPDSLRNLQTVLDPVPAELVGIEYWPEVDDQPEYDPATQELGGELLVPDAANKAVRVSRVVIDVDPEVLAARLAQQLAGAVAALLLRIDAQADAIYGRVLGNRATEYAQAEAEAGAYRDAGYAGDVPETIADWAATKGRTATWAADDILTTATAWRTAQMEIRSKRLARKEQARGAADQAELGAAAAAWEQFRAYICAQLGVQ